MIRHLMMLSSGDMSDLRCYQWQRRLINLQLTTDAPVNAPDGILLPVLCFDCKQLTTSAVTSAVGMNAYELSALLCKTAVCSNSIVLAMQNSNGQQQQYACLAKQQCAATAMCRDSCSCIPDLKVQQNQRCDEQSWRRKELVEEGVEELHDVVDIR